MIPLMVASEEATIFLCSPFFMYTFESWNHLQNSNRTCKASTVLLLKANQLFSPDDRNTTKGFTIHI